MTLRPRASLALPIALTTLCALAQAAEPQEVLGLISQGRYARAYSETLEWGATGDLDGDKSYLRAHAAYHALLLAEAGRAADRAASLGYERPASGWLAASEIRRRVAGAERLLRVGRRVVAPGGSAAYHVYAAEPSQFLDGLIEAAPAAYGAAAEVTFGTATPRTPRPALTLYVFPSNHAASRFLEHLGLRAPTAGSAASLGLGVMMWERLDRRPACPSPYSAGAGLAHETLHAFQNMLGVEGVTPWLVEGTALLAEDRVDPNHRIQTRAAAVGSAAMQPGVLERVLEGTTPPSFETYPAFYTLAWTVARDLGPRALGDLMVRRATRPSEAPADSLTAVLGMSPGELATRARAAMQSEDWAAARALSRLAELGGTSEAALRGFQAAAEQWPDEPYLGYLAAVSLLRTNRGEEARQLTDRLGRMGYLGCVDGTLDDLYLGLDGNDSDE